MTEDEIVSLGDYCENLLHSHMFTKVLEQFERQLFEHMMSSEPHEQKKREGIYATCRGVQDLLAHLKVIVQERDAIHRKYEQQNVSSEYDPQFIDYPSEEIIELE